MRTLILQPLICVQGSCYPKCGNYVPGETNVDLFASKEYLTKKLLEHVLNMELLPEIEGQE